MVQDKSGTNVFNWSLITRLVGVQFEQYYGVIYLK